MTTEQHRNGDGRLTVIIPDRLSALVEKGEVVARYYNPGNLFGEVHIVMTNDDRPEPALIQRMVGGAKLVLHNLPPPPRTPRPWTLTGNALVRLIKDDRLRERLDRAAYAHAQANWSPDKLESRYV